MPTIARTFAYHACTFKTSCVPLFHQTKETPNPTAMTTAPLATALATLKRATARMEAATDRSAYLRAVADFQAAFDAVEVLKAAQRPAPRF